MSLETGKYSGGPPSDPILTALTTAETGTLQNVLASRYCEAKSRALAFVRARSLTHAYTDVAAAQGSTSAVRHRGSFAVSKQPWGRVLEHTTSCIGQQAVRRWHINRASTAARSTAPSIKRA